MQSYLQYKRLKDNLQRDIKERGIDVAANLQDDFPYHAIWKCAETIAQRRSSEMEQVDSRIALSGYIVDEKQSDERLLIVDFQRPFDPMNPQQWSNTRKWLYTFVISGAGYIVSGAAAFDTPVTPQSAKFFGVSQDVALLSTSLYMIALGLGSLVSAPFSETVGRNPVYIICACLMLLNDFGNTGADRMCTGTAAYALFEVGAALARNIETQLVCRFFAALFGCPPITTIGGSMADIWSPLERMYVFPIICVCNFIFPVCPPRHFCKPTQTLIEQT